MCGRSTLSASGEAAVLTGNARLYCDERALAYVLLTPACNCYESSTNLLNRFGIPIQGSMDELVCEAIQFAVTRLGLRTNNEKPIVPSLADNVDRPHMESHCSSDPRTAGYFTRLKQNRLPST